MGRITPAGEEKEKCEDKFLYESLCRTVMNQNIYEMNTDGMAIFLTEVTLDYSTVGLALHTPASHLSFSLPQPPFFITTYPSPPSHLPLPCPFQCLVQDGCGEEGEGEGDTLVMKARLPLSTNQS